jgi:putative ABC transport system permease protein
MLFKENIRMAIESIKANKTRSFLTMLGIIIGISAVIVIISAGEGARRFMLSQFEEIGNTAVILSVDTDEAESTEWITLDDLDALKNRVPNIKGVTPMTTVSSTALYGKQQVSCYMTAGSPDVFMIETRALLYGRYFTEDEYLSSRKVVVVDRTTAEELFGTADVVGEFLDIRRRSARLSLKIVGVVESQTGQFYFADMPGYAFVPMTTYIEATSSSNTFSSVYLIARSKDYTESVGTAAVNLLEARHSTRGRDVYRPENMLAEMEQINSILTLVQVFIATVAAISLLVGGIGVMNIMLVAVTERTREIGIRKALGAKIGAILFQFLTESGILTLIGGLIGLTLGCAGSAAFCSIAGITPVFEMGTIAMTIFFSAAVGIFFGIYPAYKAAHLSPIEALRHE